MLVFGVKESFMLSYLNKSNTFTYFNSDNVIVKGIHAELIRLKAIFCSFKLIISILIVCDLSTF